MTWNDSKQKEMINTNDFNHQKGCIYCWICSNLSGLFGYVVSPNSEICPTYYVDKLLKDRDFSSKFWISYIVKTNADPIQTFCVINLIRIVET